MLNYPWLIFNSLGVNWLIWGQLNPCHQNSYKNVKTPAALLCHSLSVALKNILLSYNLRSQASCFIWQKVREREKSFIRCHKIFLSSIRYSYGLISYTKSNRILYQSRRFSKVYFVLGFCQVCSLLRRSFFFFKPHLTCIQMRKASLRGFKALSSIILFWEMK